MDMRKVFHPLIRIHQKYREIFCAADWEGSDVYLVSYPKSGVTWLCLLLANILNRRRGGADRVDFFSIHDFVPDMHYNPSHLPWISHPRIIKTHENFRTWKWRIDIKGRGTRYPRVIYLIRDGRAVLNSWYHYQRNLSGYKGSFKEFVNDPKVRRDDWAEHVLGWVENDTIDHRKFLLIKYEDMRLDSLNNLREIVNFIGLNVNDAILEFAIKSADIESIQKLEESFGGPVAYRQKDYRFARKGERRELADNFAEVSEGYFRANAGVFQRFGYR